MQLIVDDKPVFAATGGKDFDAADPTVVFVHGSGMDHTVWALQTRFFAWHGRSVLAVDLPGHGRSAGPALTTIGDLADWVGRLLDAAGAGEAAIVGHSLGALVALETAARQPDRVRAVALLGIGQRMGVHPDLLAAARANDHLSYDLIVSWGFASRAQIGGSRTPGLWMTGGGTRLLEQGAPGALAADLAACDGFEDALAAAGRVHCPCLFLLGDNDRMTPPKSARPLAEAIAGSRTVILPGAGHMMMIEQPDQTLDALRDAL